MMSNVDPHHTINLSFRHPLCLWLYLAAELAVGGAKAAQDAAFDRVPEKDVPAMGRGDQQSATATPVGILRAVLEPKDAVDCRLRLKQRCF